MLCRLFLQVVASGGYCLATVRGLLIVMASLVAEHGLQGTQTSVAAAWGSKFAAPRL